MTETPTTAHPSPVLDRHRAVATISAALAEVLQGHDLVLTEETKLFDDVGLDSTSALELLMRIEDEMAVEFDTDTLEQEHFRTVGSLADYVLVQIGA